MGFPIAPRTGTGPAPTPRGDASLLDLLLDGAARWIAVVGGAGLAPVAPGTTGSLVAALAFFAVARASLGSETAPVALLGTLAVAIVGTFALGTWASGRAERIFGRHDDGRIVVDEVVGQWIALVPVTLFLPRLDSFSLSVAVVTAFVAFRVFDIWKPGAVRWAERRFEGGLGVMADDVVAGVYGALVGVLPTLFLLVAEGSFLVADGSFLVAEGSLRGSGAEGAAARFVGAGRGVVA